MSESEEVLPVAIRDLPAFLAVSRSRVYAAIAALEIQKFTSETGVASVSGEDVDTLKRAFAFVRAGGSFDKFRAQNGLSELQVSDVPAARDGALEAILGGILAVLERQAAPAIAPAKTDPSDLLDQVRRRAETLDAVIRAGTTLTTGEAAAVLGLAERSLLRRSTPFEAFGMVWSRRKVGKFVEWSVRPVPGPSRDGQDT